MNDEDSDNEDDFIARQYQTILCEQALKSNRILFLPTGSGKTYIAIMVLKKLFNLLEPDFGSGGKRAFFLVNTVPLVDQQAKVLERHLLLDEVGRYSGDMNVDSWDLNTWNKEFCKYQVLVMTAEILNKLLLNKFISLPQIALIILDECHHAVEDHPMRQIMRLFEDCPLTEQPRVIGLTATLLNANPKNIPAVRDAVKKLEVTLHSTIATVDSWEVVKQFSTKPKESIVTFETFKNQIVFDAIQQKVDDLYNVINCLEGAKCIPVQGKIIPGFSPMYNKKGRELANLIKQIVKQFEWLGIYGCLKTIQAIYVMLQVQQQKKDKDESYLMMSSIYCSLLALSRYVVLAMGLHHRAENEKAELASSPKVHCLLKVLEDHYMRWNARANDKNPQPMQTVVFVEEKMTAKILCSVLKNIAKNSNRYNFIKAEFVVGGNRQNSPMMETIEGAYAKFTNDKILNRFRENDINVLISTDVMEEGIDIPACNLVLRFDQAKTFRSYVQSKGRTRHDRGSFILMVPRSDQSKYSNKIEFFKEIYSALEECLVGHTHTRVLPTDKELSDLYEADVEPYYTSIGSKVTMTSAISLVNNYCMSLAHDRFCDVSPSWHKKHLPNKILCAIQLPRISPVQDLVKGLAMENIKLAKRAAALEMCKHLHQKGELNDNLLPNDNVLEECDEKELLPLWQSDDKNLSSQPSTGTTRKTRSYPNKIPLCFEDCAPMPNQELYLQYLEIYPVQNTLSTLDMRKLMIQSTLREKRNFAILTVKPMAQLCQFPVFSKFGAINVKVISNTGCICLTEDQFMHVTNFHWNLFTTIIPIAGKNVVFSRDSFLLAPTKVDENGCVVLDWQTMTMKADAKQWDSSPEKCVVKPIHRGLSGVHEVYFVTRVTELTSLSKFPNSSYSTYQDYFRERHNFKILKPEQPLLEVQSFSCVSNDLLPRMKQSNDSDAIHFPVEACEVKYTDGCLFLKAALLPSILHRLERFLMAEQLREIIAHGARIINQTSHPGNGCTLWMQTEESIRNAGSSIKTCEPLPSPSVLSKGSPPAKKRKLLKLWGNLQEPLDIDHNFETATQDQIMKYVDFVQKRVSSFTRPTGESRKLPTVKKGEAAIKLLTGGKNGPHCCHILEATTAASADDFWNLERLETLGDSFLKFAVSFVLFNRLPSLSEGKLTQIKGRILGNRNLFYCAEAKQLGCYLKVHKVVPSEGWIPPSFAIPRQILDMGLVEKFRKVHLSKEEQYNNTLNSSTLDELMNEVSILDDPELTPKKEFGHNLIPDKTVADCVEALIGACLETAGPKAAMRFLEWMKVLPSGSEDMLRPDPVAPSSTHFSRINSINNKISEQFGYKFRNVDLLAEALTHSSSPVQNESRTYERLEFIGDALLDFLITSYIYENCGRLTPGELTDLRSALVNNITFACLCVRYGLNKFLNAGSIALMDAMDKFVQFQETRDHVIDDEVLTLLEENECSIAETVCVPKALGDVYEALVGAVYLDSGRDFSVVWSVIYRLMKTEICNFSKNVPKQIVRRLYEAVGQNNMQFRVSDATTSLMMSQVHVVLTVRMNGTDRRFDGFGANKSQAKKSAAKLALRQLNNDNSL